MTKRRDNINRLTRPRCKEAGEDPERAGRGNEDDQMLFIKFPKKKLLKKQYFKLHYRDLLAKTAWLWHKKTHRSMK